MKFSKLFILIILIIISCLDKKTIKEKKTKKILISETKWVNVYPGIKLRSKPSIKADIIDSISFQEEVFAVLEKKKNINISGVNGKWCKIVNKGKTGWVFNKYLNNQHPTETKLIGYGN